MPLMERRLDPTTVIVPWRGRKGEVGENRRVCFLCILLPLNEDSDAQCSCLGPLYTSSSGIRGRFLDPEVIGRLQDLGFIMAESRMGGKKDVKIERLWRRYATLATPMVKEGRWNDLDDYKMIDASPKQWLKFVKNIHEGYAKPDAAIKATMLLMEKNNYKVLQKKNIKVSNLIMKSLDMSMLEIIEDARAAIEM
ncbi:hypothetical protein KSP40_PGU006740 [Platanthera guangdongensis]|uniref:Uncharacterized protein n=1 Tax=Platanthera guangdongensis TaxID=2320717 RepID=A0ABR2M010_9ASPA